MVQVITRQQLQARLAVSVYAGGKKDWKEAGLPLESLAQAA